MKARFFLFAAIAAAGALAACGGGGSGPPAGSGLPGSLSTTSAFSSTSTTAVTLGTVSNQIAASMTLPEANASATANLTYRASLPSSVSAPDAATIGKRVALSDDPSFTTLGVVELTVSSTISVNATPAFSFTLPSAPAGDAYIAYYDEDEASNGWSVLLGPGSVSGDAVTFAAQSLVPPITLAKGDTYLFALVTSAAAVSQPAAAVYAGTKTVNYVYNYEFGYPTPGPTATAPPATLSYAVTDDISLGSSPFPSSAPSGVVLVDAHVAETDASSLSSTAYATDEWAGLTNAAGSFQLAVYGTEQQEPASSTLPVFQTIYDTPQLLDEYPEKNGASWSNSPAANIAYSYADGDGGTRAIASNGTYTDSENLLVGGAGGSVVMAEDSNGDGGGSITGPFAGGLYTGISFSPPSGGELQITFTLYNSTTESAVDSVWYTVPPVFYSETDKVTSGAAIPASCSIGGTANDVNRTITTLDTLVGDEETTVMDSYDDASGIPLCLVSTDTVSYAYLEEDTTPYLLLFAPELGLEIQTTSETLVLQPGASSGALPATASRDTASVARFSGSTASPVLAALENHVLNGFYRTRLAQEHNYLRSLRTLKSPAQLVIKGAQR